MTLKEILDYCLTHKCFEDVEIYVNGKPAISHYYWFKPDYNTPGEPSTLYKIDLTDKI